MQTQTIKRRELHQAIDALTEDSVIAMLSFIKSMQLNANDDNNGFYDHANIRWLEHSLEQAKQGKVVVKTVEELERMANE